MPRRPARRIEAPTAPFWTTTYGDLMSLVLVFFVFLAAFSSIDITQYRAVQQSVKASGGQGVLKPEMGGALVEMPKLPESREFQDAMQDLGEEMKRAELNKQVRVFWDKQGVRFVLQDAILFPPGEAALNPNFLKILDRVIAVIGTLEVKEIQVEGHTDDVPIRTERYASNWELSSARSVSVLRYLERSKTLSPRQLVANGYGQYRPLVPNNSDGNRAQNRRVEIFVLRK